MISRLSTRLLLELAGQFPAVLIVGPRQAGKTTLAKASLSGEYFDLEKPSDLQVFSGDPELALRRFPGPIIMDEAQTLPQIFPVLRALIDEDRGRKGRFFLLGSVNPALVRQVSESLAGRVGLLELTPFLYPEAAAGGLGLEHHWLSGGFPDACLEAEPVRRQRWYENYIRAVLERDLPRLGVRASPVQMRRLLGMIAGQHGGILNASELGRSLGVTYHTVSGYLDLLEGHFLVRRLEPYFANVTKRLVKAPRLYVRDTGLLHHLLGIADERALLESAKRGASFEGYLVEQVVALEGFRSSLGHAYFYRTHAGAEIDLVLDRGQERVGFEFKCSLSASPSDWANLRSGIAEGIIHRGYVVNLGGRNFEPAEGIRVVGAAEFLQKGLGAGG